MAPVCINLLSGAGGMAEGFRRAGWKVAFASCDRDAAAETFAHNHPSVPFLLENIHELTADRISEAAGMDASKADALCCGAGSADIRDGLAIREFLRLAEEIRPEIVLLGCAPSASARFSIEEIDAMADFFRSMGYACAYGLSALDRFGIPQKAGSLMIAARRGLESHPVRLFPQRTAERTKTAGDALAGLPKLAPGEGADRMPDGTPLWNHEAAPLRRRLPALKHGEGRERLRRLDPDRPAPALAKSFRTSLLHPFQDRGLTCREGARLQSFGDPYRFFGTAQEQADMIADAVPPALIHAFAESIAKALAIALPA